MESAVRNEVREFLREFLKKYCERLEEKEEGEKLLFFCQNRLIGAVIPLDEEKLAVTVYGYKLSDPLLREFPKALREKFGERLIEQGVKMSGALNENFYYAYNWLKL
ncbi:MAG: hypothetical protein GXN96_06410 [Aquificae bacterium]|nr:hypothetical protein [Aquificota bacterium]